ncbi:MAG: uridine kinase family protein [Marmoricola sp.]
MREVVDRVLGLAASRPPTLGAGRLVCVDGPAGAGKTTLAAALAEASGAPVLHVDDLLEGWTGLDTARAQLTAVLAALAQGRTARWRRWDWEADHWAEEHRLAPAPLFVVEGVGSARRAWAASTTVLVWVEASPAVRLRRGLARDGEGARAHWERWRDEEAALFAAEGTRARADVVHDTEGGQEQR